MQAEGTGLARQFHARFLGCAAAFAVIAGMATGDEISNFLKDDMEKVYHFFAKA